MLAKYLLSHRWKYKYNFRMNYYVLNTPTVSSDYWSRFLCIFDLNIVRKCFFLLLWYIPVFWNFHGRSGRNLSKIGPIDVPKHDLYPHLHLHGDNSRQIPYIWKKKKNLVKNFIKENNYFINYTLAKKIPQHFDEPWLQNFQLQQCQVFYIPCKTIAKY